MKWTLVIACLFQVVLVKAQSAADFRQQIVTATEKLTCANPDERTPVTLNAQLISSAGSDSIAVIVKARMAPGWHIYAYVPQTKPYIVTECILKADANAKPAGAWEKSRPVATAMDQGVLIYEKEATFIQKLKKTSKGATGNISAGLYYQTCNLRQCLPPVEKVVELKY